MATAIRTKEDIEFHQLGNGYRTVPAVNVKVYDSLDQGYRKWREDNPDANPHFTVDWIEEHVSDELGWSYFGFSCEMRWEDLQMRAEEIYGKHVKVYSEGRQGGWAYIEGINHDIEDWDAIEFSRWKNFAEFARGTADYIMADVVDYIYNNNFEEWKRA